MKTDDPRHGTHAGYVAGCHEECCKRARLRENKRRQLYRIATGGPCRVDHDTFRAVVEPWLSMGISPYAIEKAAGVEARIADALRDKTSVLRSTLAAVAGLTEDDFPGSAKVYSDLTRTRIHSLMAAGHRLVDMPINPRGHWRSRERIAIECAREIRAFYAANEFKIGPDRHTAARARNRGIRPPLAWDDPGTLAWPDGKVPRIVIGTNRRSKDSVDPVAVERAVAGDRVKLTRAERFEVVARLRAQGVSFLEIEARTVITKPERYIVREEGAA